MTSMSFHCDTSEDACISCNLSSAMMLPPKPMDIFARMYNTYVLKGVFT